MCKLQCNMFDPTFCLTYSELESRNGPGYIDYMDEMEGICSQEFGEMGRVGTNMHMNVFNILSRVLLQHFDVIEFSLIGGHGDNRS